MKIKSIAAREILSSGGFPTLETKIYLENGLSNKASVPFGASAGKYEAVTLLDHDTNRFMGNGMLAAVKNITEIIAPALQGVDIDAQTEIDKKLLELDPTSQKEKIGGNTMLSVSLACARTASFYEEVPLYKYLRNTYNITGDIVKLPKPMMVVIEGGKHADNSTDFQEYLLSIISDAKTADRIRAGVEIHHNLGQLLKKEGFNTNVGNEGAYAPEGIKSNSLPLKYLSDAIETSGYNINKDVGLSLDVASSEFYSDGKYNLKCEKLLLNSNELTDYYNKIINEFNLFSIEDLFSEDDWPAWQEFGKNRKDELLIVGDDLTVTNQILLKKAIDTNSINSMIVKPNQIGTLTETMETVSLAQKNGIKTIVSHRGGGETPDTFIADLAVAVEAEFIKNGPSRGERTEKYNRLLEIADELKL